MRTLENPLVKAGASGWFALRRGYYRLRYRNLVVGPGVLFIGRLKLARGTRLSLGANCRIRQTVIVNGGGEVSVGEHTLLNGCWIGSAQRVEIGAWSLISDCNISDTDFHNLAPRERHLPASDRASAPVVIGRNVWVGARAIVLKGTRIGADSVVGSGSVVRGEVPEAVVVAGNPAVVVKTFAADQRSAPSGPPHAPEARVPEQRILSDMPALVPAPHGSGPNGQVP
jgi:acetyltransferase-like isoleucine patch superfamily enzyme